MCVLSTLLLIQLIVVVRVHLEVMEGKFFSNSLLKRSTFLQSQGVGLGDNGNDINDIGKLLEDNDINGLEAARNVRLGY